MFWKLLHLKFFNRSEQILVSSRKLNVKKFESWRTSKIYLRPFRRKIRVSRAIVHRVKEKVQIVLIKISQIDFPVFTLIFFCLKK